MAVLQNCGKSKQVKESATKALSLDFCLRKNLNKRETRLVCGKPQKSFNPYHSPLKICRKNFCEILDSSTKLCIIVLTF